MSDHPSKEYHAFTSLVDKLLTVPKETVRKRVEAYQKESAKNDMRPVLSQKPK